MFSGLYRLIDREIIYKTTIRNNTRTCFQKNMNSKKRMFTGRFATKSKLSVGSHIKEKL